MAFVQQLENTFAGWTKNLPHLPVNGQRWLAHNLWWIVLIGAILSGVGVLFGLFGLLLGGVAASFVYVVNPAIATLLLIAGLVGLGFLIVRAILLGMAVKPLQNVQKKGWTLVFTAFLVEILSVAVSAVFNLVTANIIGFFVGLIFGAISLAIAGYFLFEVHGQFAPVAHAKAKKA